MKAYVIKNKEGKYYKQYFDDGYVDFIDNILFCELYAKRIGAEDTIDFILRNKYKFNIENLEVVEITIAEGDLERQLAEKDKEIKSLEQQIENNQRDYVSELAYYTAEENIKEIRKQVCDEIKIALSSTEPNCSIEDMNSNLYEFSGREIYAILDQIEKGEE